MPFVPVDPNRRKLRKFPADQNRVNPEPVKAPAKPVKVPEAPKVPKIPEVFEDLELPKPEIRKKVSKKKKKPSKKSDKSE